MLQLYSSKYKIIRLIVIITFLIITSFLIFITYSLGKNFQLKEPIIFEISKGENYQDIFLKLRKLEIIEYDKIHFNLFRVINKIKADFYFQAGEYLITKDDNYFSLIKKLTNGAIYERKYTIIEGVTSKEVVELLNQIDFLSGKITQIPKEGSLLPDTYFYRKGSSRAEQIELMQNKMSNKLNEIWKNRDQNIPLKNKHELLILASIVEKETAISTERNHVAGVFINRINKKMKLQSDPTVIYAVTKGKYKLARPLRKSDLRIKSEFNTYYTRALPPTPIANPGIAALIATSKPKKTQDLYFVSDGFGSHNFAKTLIEHNRNVQKLRKIEKQRRNENK